MFDIGFSELMVIGLIALVVIGPEKLPRVARTLGHLAGRLQRYVTDVKADINREIELEDLRKMRDSVQQAAADIQGSMNAVNADLAKMESELNTSVSALAAEPAAAASTNPTAASPDEPAPAGTPAAPAAASGTSASTP